MCFKKDKKIPRKEIVKDITKSGGAASCLTKKPAPIADKKPMTAEKPRQHDVQRIAPKIPTLSILYLKFIIKFYLLYLFIKRELLITDTELNAMAAPAIMGFKRNPVKGYRAPAAIGIPMAL